MADKYHNAWIIRQIVTAYRIIMAEIMARGANDAL